MKAPRENESKNPFVNVAENLFRDTRTGKYYVKVKKHGKQFNRSLKTTVRAMADIRLRAELEKFEGVKEATDMNIRFEPFARAWVALRTHATIAATQEKNEYRLKHLLDFFGAMVLRKITTGDCLGWVTKHGLTIAPVSFARELAMLKQIFQHAIKQRIIIDNPAEDIKNPKVPKKKLVMPSREQFGQLVAEIRFPSKTKNMLLAEQIIKEYSNAESGEVEWSRAFAEHADWREQLLKGDAVKGMHRLHSFAYVYKKNANPENVVDLNQKQNAKDGADLVEFLTYSGSRQAEGNSSLWRDVDFEAGTITINGTKTETAQRTIPMLPPLIEFLKRLKAERNPKPEDRIIPIKSARKCLQTACTRLGLRVYTHHHLRHLFATTCIEAGVPIPTLAEWLGHNDGGVLAMKTYGHIRKEHSFDMAALVKSFAPNPVEPIEPEPPIVVLQRPAKG